MMTGSTATSTLNPYAKRAAERPQPFDDPCDLLAPRYEGLHFDWGVVYRQSGAVTPGSSRQRRFRASRFRALLQASKLIRPGPANRLAAGLGIDRSDP